MNRAEALEIIQSKPWYERTSVENAAKIHGLGDDWTGYLVDLANRKDSIGGLEVVSLSELLLGGFGCLTRFKVKNQKGVEFLYEYFSWKKGPMSGAKGLVFIADKNGKITHFAYLEVEKFAAGGIICVDLPGGFCEDIDTTTATKFLTNMTRELSEEFGATEINVISAINIGQYTPDYGMTNNAPFLFSVVISADFKYDGINADMYEVRSNVKVRPICELKKATTEISDGFFLACIAKLWATDSLPTQ